MSMKKRTTRTSLAILMAAVMTALAACSGNSGGGNEPAPSTGGQTQQTTDNKDAAPAEQEPAKQEPLKISFMVPGFDPENLGYPDDDSIIIKTIEEYTNADLTMQFVPNSSYPDKMNITLASGELPTLMVTDPKNPSFINAARNGAFWEIGPYLKDYQNLAQANPVVLNNTSIDGKIYGMYRARTLGRNGMTLNADWMKNLGLEAPKTLDEFYNVMKAFSENDPDGNGKDDTYGIVITKWHGPWDIMQVWFGAPNKWGEDASGNLVPTHMTPEYREALKFFKKLYDEKLVNEDFAVMDSAVWNDPFINGEVGVFVDVADNARRLDGSMQEKYGKREESYTAVFQAPVGPKGHRDMPTSGYNGVIAISKSAVKTEDELKRVLTFLDQLNDVEMQMVLENGIEGRHYNMVDGFVVPIEDQEAGHKKERLSLNQMTMYIGPVIPTREQTAINVMIADVQKKNEEIIVGNPAEPLISEVYAQKGQQLDNIINDARIQYIVGQIDDAGFDAAVQLWLSTGGQEYIDEINKLYKASK
ncbi:extracellular solute-binding protein [Paenibacillus sp.]|uniref:extracellular solute-binding protein n=1 Tax=Paenibacillus sp. TaxID=58172 RepID=UPI002810C1B7|nr:extracellular solute-binding protein [Paenibacillus sp.]